LLSVSAAEQSQQFHFAGLTSEDAQHRLEQYGKNEAGTKRAHSPWIDLLLLLVNPLAIVLLVAATISAVIGQKIDAFIIIALVLIGAGIDFVQTYRSRIVIERLRATVATLASVERDGKWVDLPRAELVPGDLIRLCAGD
jgi:Mg2+-importing ATPase